MHYDLSTFALYTRVSAPLSTPIQQKTNTFIVRNFECVKLLAAHRDRPVGNGYRITTRVFVIKDYK
jgi:hypothetical protein